MKTHTKMSIRNGRVFSRDLQFHRKDVLISNGWFAADGDPSSAEHGNTDKTSRPASQDAPSDETVLDASGCYVIPGLIDIHFHGALGYDICDTAPEAFEKIAAYEAGCGITAICPATLTLPSEALLHALAVGAAYAREHSAQRRSPSQADLIGFNMEGPFISYEKRGAQNPDYILPCDVGLLHRFIEASDGLLKIIGLAPEANPGFEDYIRRVPDSVTISLAHTNCDYDIARRALNAGADHLVHMYNAMRDLSHRDPGPIGAVMDHLRQHPESDLTCELICDGIHVHPSAVRAAFRLMGSRHIILISDSLRCTGMPDGDYDLGGELTAKSGRYCRLKNNDPNGAPGNIAGSVSNLMDCLQTAVTQMDIPLEAAVASATLYPAERIGADKLYGSIEPGKRGNLVLLDQESLQVRAVVKDGVQIR